MKPEEFEKCMEKGDIRPLYYFYGDEPYLIEKCVKRVVERLVPPDFKDFNLNIFYGKESKGAEVVDAARTLPMFADRRLIIVKKGDELNASALESISDYLRNPSTSTCLVFVGEKIDQRKKFFTEFKKTGELVEFKRPYENQLHPFIRQEAATHGKRVEPQAADALVFLCGNNLQELASQIEKSATYIGERETITVADIKAIASDTRVDSVFELADAMGRKSLGKALCALNRLLGDGEAPLFILGMMTRHFRQIWTVRALLDRRTPQGEMAKAAGINPYFIKGVVEQAQNYKAPELKGLFERFFETDLALKSGGGKPAILMERLVMDICGSASYK